MLHPKPHAPMLTPPVVPLTLTNTHGERYARLPAVQTQLGDLLALDTRAAQEARITESDRDAITYVQEESVAYFVREAHRKGDRGAGNWLAERTLERCNGFIAKHLYGLHGADHEDARSVVVGQMFRTLLDLEHPRGEYYQVRFWNKLNRQCADAYTARRITPGVIGIDDRKADPLDAVPDAGALPSALMEDGDTVRRALQYLRERLPERQCEAFVLRYLFGYPIGDKGESGTLADLFNVSPRSINNWINAAKHALHDWWGTEGHG